MSISLRSALLSLSVVSLGSVAQADILRWDNSQVIPASVGVTPGPGIDVCTPVAPSRNFQYAALSSQNLAAGNFIGSDFCYAKFVSSNLSNATFQYAHLDNASFSNSNLANVNLAHAGITGANFANVSNLSHQAFASTYSYATHNLTGTNFLNLNLAGWNFTKLYLVNATFGLPSGAASAQASASAAPSGLSWADFSGACLHNASLAGVNLSGSNLQGADLSASNLQNAILRSADLRGAIAWNPNASIFTANAIRPNGTVQGLALAAGEKLVVRNSLIPITVKTAATMNPAATIAFQLKDNFNSQIHFDAGVTPSLTGTLDLSVAPGINPATLVGHSFKLFAWNAGPDAGHQFASITSAPGLTWDTSSLYTTGTVTLAAMASNPVPEPASLTLLIPAAAVLIRRRRD